jgi:hypothetical protein
LANLFLEKFLLEDKKRNFSASKMKNMEYSDIPNPFGTEGVTLRIEKRIVQIVYPD